MSGQNVIVFGPTGRVGSIAALTAYQEGARVFLAMRDVAKSIPMLDEIPAQRVYADLTKPETIQDAVQQTGATVAFIYPILDASDHMLGSIKALKEAGIKSVVLLSSCSVDKDNPRQVPDFDFLGTAHARVEISLEEIFGVESFTTIRPGFFTSNLLWLKNAILNGEVLHPQPNALLDYIAPEDVGRVSGIVLAHSCQQHIIRLFGPTQRRFKDAMDAVGQVLGRTITTKRVAIGEATEAMVASGLEEFLVQVIVEDASRFPAGEFPYTTGAEEGAANVARFTRQEPITLEQWVQKNKSCFDE